jgi:epoxyqueuosine reductase
VPVSPATADAVPDLAARVKAAARAAGFDAAGICDLAPIERPALREWLARGYAGTMGYLPRQARKRQRPADIAPGCRRAVVVLKNYYQPVPRRRRRRGRVARYAWGEDYHRVLGARLAHLARALVELGSTPAHTRWYVDAGPVPERELAQRAGLGWIAKNTMLIHPALGSFTFIGSVLTDLDVPVDPPFVTDHCGSCRACLDACPTAAFPAARVLDARRCISYLTIERRGAFEAAEGPLIGDWLFGCDVCQDVCPWNEKFAAATDEPRFAPRAAVVAADLHALATIDDPAFDATYGDTAFARPGPAGIARNARQVVENQLTVKSSQLTVLSSVNCELSTVNCCSNPAAARAGRTPSSSSAA